MTTIIIKIFLFFNRKFCVSMTSPSTNTVTAKWQLFLQPYFQNEEPPPYFLRNPFLIGRQATTIPTQSSFSCKQACQIVTPWWNPRKPHSGFSDLPALQPQNLSSICKHFVGGWPNLWIFGNSSFIVFLSREEGFLVPTRMCSPFPPFLKLLLGVKRSFERTGSLFVFAYAAFPSAKDAAAVMSL